MSILQKGTLCLTRTSDRPVRPTSGRCIAIRRGIGTWGLADRGDLHVPHVNKRLLASVTTRATSLGSLVICRDVEGDEENEVRGDDDHSGESSEFFSGALARVGHPWEVGGREVGVGGEVNKACAPY